MINGKNEQPIDINKDESINTDLLTEEPMEVDSIFPSNNTNGCNRSIVDNEVEDVDSNIYFDCFNNTSNNKDLVDDTGDLYADDDEARPTGVLKYTFHNISQYKELEPGKEKKLLSDAIKIRCLPWKILIMFRVQSSTIGFDLKQRHMGIFLQCNADCESTSWTCNAKAKITLVSHSANHKSTGDPTDLQSPTSTCEENNEQENNQLVQHHNNENHSVVRTIEHNFYSKENDWGFSNFISLQELFNPDKHFVENDSITISIRINADAPHGIDWDSKRHTGFVGLKNQGATCYLNSLLQTLFFTNKLRKAVYMMPTYSDEATVSVPLALQRVFYELQFSDKSVGTKKLTRSFGWETLDSFMQHDAQELCRVLMDNMENKMKGTFVENMIPSLFCGKMLSYIKCKHVPLESTREENFYDIQLKVKNNRTIYDAFQEYINVETLDNDNKYDAGQYGLQEAEKGVIFLNFPPVLYLQLMRFQFDFTTETNVKINDRFEFYLKMDLSKYLKTDEAANTDTIEGNSQYFLHAVLVHSGDNHGGHYVVYLNPKGDNKWYKFDDDVVSRCSIKEAIDMNYGGHDEDSGVRQCTNAYMLVYMNEACKSDILCDVTESDIPSALLNRFAKEHVAEAAKRREKAEAHLFTFVNLLLEEDFYGWPGFDLCSTAADVPQRKIRVSKSASLDELIQQICDTLKLQPEHVRLWQMKPRKNQTNRITVLDFKENFLKQDIIFFIWVESVPVSILSDLNHTTNAIDLPSTAPSETNQIPYSPKDKMLPITGSSPSSIDSLFPFDINNDLLVFLKYYDYRTRTIHYCGYVIIRIQSTLQMIKPLLCQRANLPESTQLLIYEERKPLHLELINPEFKIEQCVEMLMDGNIIVYQEKPPSSLQIDASVTSIPLSNSLSDNPNQMLTAIDYFNDFSYQNDVIFIDKNNPDDQSGFVLRMSGKSSYQDMAKAVGHYLNYPSDKLQFFRSQPGFSNKEIVGNCIRSSFDGEIKDFFAHYPRNKTHKRIYYEKLTMHVEELENMRQVHCFYVNDKLSEEVFYRVNLNRSATIKDLIEAIIKQSCSASATTLPVNNNIVHNIEESTNQNPPIDLKPNNNSETELSPEKFRVFEISSCKIIQQYSLDSKISQIPTNVNRHLRVEQIPLDEQQLASNEELIYVAHFHKDSYSTFGIPFALKIRDGETFSSVKDRIKRRLDVPDKEFDKWRFAIVSGRATYLPDEPESIVSTNAFHSHNFNTLSASKPWLGIEHKPTKRPRVSGCEKPIKIHN